MENDRTGVSGRFPLPVLSIFSPDLRTVRYARTGVVRGNAFTSGEFETFRRIWSRVFRRVTFYDPVIARDPFGSGGRFVRRGHVR